MAEHEWVRSFPGEVMVCDPEGIILEMNEGAAQVFAQDGGMELIGQNLLDCHPAAARAKLVALMTSCQSNTYTTEKNGVKRLFHQVPWYDQHGSFSGFVELSFELPRNLPNFARD